MAVKIIIQCVVIQLFVSFLILVQKTHSQCQLLMFCNRTLIFMLSHSILKYYSLYSCIKSYIHRNEDDVASKHENEDEVDEELSDTKEKDKEKEKEVENEKIVDESPTINEQKESTAEPMEIGESKLAEAEAEVGTEAVDVDRPNSSGRIILVFYLIFFFSFSC